MTRATGTGEASAADAALFGAETAWQRFEVPFEFPVVFTEHLFDTANPAFVEALRRREPAKRHRALVLIDEGAAAAAPGLVGQVEAYFAAHAGSLALVAPPEIVAGGERIKTELTHLEHMQDRIHELRIDRHSYVVAIGGGAVLDAAGLAAATAHRGVRHVRVPTTVLSQNDSGVGVKNAVNLKGVKNYVGTFAPPWAVLNDYAFIRALPARERRAGIAEAVKVALFREGDFFRWLEANADRLATFEETAEREMIRRCAALHMKQIGTGGDPFEMGSARPLDYGHWAAHKLEAMTRHRLRHGEAVAIGVALDARYSVLAGLLPEGGDARVAALLEHLGFDIFHPALERRDAAGASLLLAGLDEFREHLGGELTITLLSALGTGVEVNEMDGAKVAESIGWLRTRTGR